MKADVASLRSMLETAARGASEDANANFTFNALWEKLGRDERGARADIRRALQRGELSEYLEDALRIHQISIDDV